MPGRSSALWTILHRCLMLVRITSMDWLLVIWLLVSVGHYHGDLLVGVRKSVDLLRRRDGLYNQGCMFSAKRKRAGD